MEVPSSSVPTAPTISSARDSASSSTLTSILICAGVCSALVVVELLDHGTDLVQAQHRVLEVDGLTGAAFALAALDVGDAADEVPEGERVVPVTLQEAHRVLQEIGRAHV